MPETMEQNIFRLPRYNEIPNVGLYLEQTGKYLADYLALIDNGQLVLNCGRDDVDAMGVAHLRTSELETVRAGSVAHDMPALRHDLSYDLLVPDRAAFLRAYPDYICDRASIDDVMVLLVKGEVR